MIFNQSNHNAGDVNTTVGPIPLGTILWKPIGDGLNVLPEECRRDHDRDCLVILWSRTGYALTASMCFSRSDPRGILAADDGELLRWDNFTHFAYVRRPE